MNKIKLKDVVFYSKERIPYSGLKLESYVSTENLLQNKQGVTRIDSLPASINNTTKYSNGNILISNIRPYLKKIWYAKNGGGVSSDVLTFVVKNDFDSRFVYYNLFQDEFFDHMMAGSKGTKMPRGDKNQILEFNIPNLELPTQQKIAGVLSALDDKIELNNKINAELEAMAKTLYDYWFVQFDFPDANGKPYKSSGGKMVWNEVLKRDIPEGWETGTLSDISELIRGVSYDKKAIKTSNCENVIPILRATNIDGNQINLTDMVYVPKELVSEKQILKKFDILMTMSSGSINHIGKNGFYFYDETVSFGAFCVKFVPNNNYHFFLYNYTQSDFMFSTIKNECLGTNINNLNSGMVNGFKLILPPTDTLLMFNKRVEALYNKISVNLKQNQELTQLRDWLLPMLMNGQVTVGEAEGKLAKTMNRATEI